MRLLDALDRICGTWSTGAAAAIMIGLSSLVCAVPCYLALALIFAAIGWPPSALDSWMIPAAFIYVPFGAGIAAPHIRDMLRRVERERAEQEKRRAA